ncbi:hypothetical protein RJ639_023200 [Escallonia herrerae]|uniref:Nuclear envelope integral membrane protein 1 n=1 Tax=Escallonia herrerae TaxID=1293975 RepID=A0AA88UZN6_9ASTE|nr:hypothetical protein RJ639_023200 [Escallonia herrerae]
MGTALVLWFLYLSSCSVSAEGHSLVVAQSTTLQLSPGVLVERSPGIKPGVKVVCERVHICGLLRLKNLRKFAHLLKVNVSHANSSDRLPNVEVCFHRNASLGIGMCPQGQWERLTKGSWARSMSPFDHKLLDIRLTDSSSANFVISIHEEFLFYRLIFLALGITMLTLASFLSKSLVFYYSGAMAVGVALVILIILFQGMKLLPTGRKSSLAVFLYSSLIGLGTFVLSYVPRLLRSILVEMGVSEDMYNPLAVIVLFFIVVTGAWLGFWVVRKFVLTEDGSVDTGVSLFVAWSIRIFASVMILQSSVDPLLAAGALVCGVTVSSILRRVSRRRFMRHLYKTDKSRHRRSPKSDSSPVEDAYGSSTKRQPSQLSDTETFYSSFHNTPERRKVSKEEWERFTKESTRNALEGLVASPDFSKWAAAHADRITLTPNKDTTERRKRWLPWS